VLDASFRPHLERRITDRQRTGEAGWRRIPPVDWLTSAQIEAFVSHFEIDQRNPDKPVSQSARRKQSRLE
jgi:hypothetical protein